MRVKIFDPYVSFQAVGGRHSHCFFHTIAKIVCYLLLYERLTQCVPVIERVYIQEKGSVGSGWEHSVDVGCMERHIVCCAFMQILSRVLEDAAFVKT